jgi:hypothetical protein
MENQISIEEYIKTLKKGKKKKWFIYYIF